MALHSAIDPAEGDLLQQLIREKKPNVGLEIGLAFGVSALFICEALASAGGKRHIILDPAQSSGWRRIGLNNLEKAGFKWLIDFREQESQLGLAQLVREDVRVDFAFVDGAHTFDHVLVDFFFIDRLLRVGGIVAFDDAQFPAVHRVCRFVAINRAYRVCAVAGGKGEITNAAKILRSLSARSTKLRRCLQARFTQPDEELGFHWDSRLIAFEKTAEDSRAWDFDHDF